MLPSIIPNLLREFQKLTKKRGNQRSYDIGFPQFAAVPVVFLSAKCGGLAASFWSQLGYCSEMDSA